MIPKFGKIALVLSSAILLYFITRVITQRTMDTKFKNLKSAKNSVPLSRSFVNIFLAFNAITVSGWGSPAHTISFTTVVLQPIDLLCLKVHGF